MNAPSARRSVLALVLLATAVRADAARISGRLLDAEGNAVAGVRVAAVPFRDQELRWLDETRGSSPTVLVETRTDASGLFVLEVPANDASISIRVEPSASPGALLPGPFDSRTAVSLPDVLLPVPLSVGGLVLAPGRAPVAGARVTIRAESGALPEVVAFTEALTGSDGSFRAANAPSGPRAIEVRSAGYAPFARGSPAGRLDERIEVALGGGAVGLVTDPAGHPAGGAIVFSEGVAAETDASGRYRLSGIPAGGRTIEAVSGEAFVSRRTDVPVRAGAESGVNLRLEAAASIGGTVIDAISRRPIASARVAIFDGPAPGPGASAGRVAITDSSGRFRAGPLLPGRFAVLAQRADYLSSQLSGIGASVARPGRAAIALEPAASVAGKVVDERGQPVRGARVRLERAPAAGRFRRGPGFFAPVPQTVTGPDGSFRLDRLAASSGVTLAASGAGFVPSTRPGLVLKAGQSVRNLVLTLRTGLTASGRVVDEQNQPVAGALIRVARADDRTMRGPFRPAGGDGNPDATSRDDGSFTVGGLEEGDYRVSAARDGYAPKTLASVAVTAKPPTRWPAIVLVRGVAVAGVVKDGEGHPVPGALVNVFVEGETLRSASTDGAGAFRIADLSRGRAAVIGVNAAGFAPGRSAATPPAENVVVVLNKTATIRGRVEDAETGSPVKDFTISRSAGPGGRGRGFGPGGGAPGGGVSPLEFHSDDGTFELADVPPGSWTARAVAAGYRPADVSGIEVGEAEVKEGVVLSLRRGATISGKVVDAAAGAPVANATVAVSSAGVPAAGPPGTAPASGSTAQTDADGHFALDALPDGKVTLTVSHPDYLTASRSADPAATSDLTIALGKGGDISGVVVSAGGSAPVTGATVVLAAEGDTGAGGGFGSQTAQVDASGAFRFDHLGPGRYQLSAQSKTASSAPQEIVLADGQAMDGVQVPVASGVEIDGTVSGLPAGQLGGVAITATADGYRATAVTGDDGKFTVQNAPAGVVRFSASTSFLQGRSAAQTVDVPDDASQLPVEIVFQGQSRLSGQVTQAGKPLPGVSVAAIPSPPNGAGQRSSALTDGAGHYALEGLDDGDYQVGVNGPGVSYRKTLTVSGSTNGDVDIPALAVSGTVTDSASGKPVDGASIQLETGTEAQSASVKRAVTDSNGYYTVADLEGGSYQVTARKAGYQLKVQTASLDSQSAEVDFALDPGSGVAIQVTDGVTGIPLGGVSALAFGSTGGIAFQGAVSLDATGTGEIPSLAPGQYSVYVFSAGYAPRAMSPLSVPSGTVPVAMTPGGRVEARASSPLSGRITDGSGALVLLSPFRFDGSVTIAPPVTVWEHLAPGSYTLLVSTAGGDKPFPFSVAEGQTSGVTLP
jgi:protocatechuate 3,4-dioxygenase beta subunit